MLDLIERRGDPRFDVSLPATITSQDGQSIRGEICNISRSGMRVIISNEHLPLLMPNIGRDHHQPLPLKMAIELPELTDPIIVHCGMLYFNRVSRQTSSAGCRFEFFEEGAVEALMGFLQGLKA